MLRKFVFSSLSEQLIVLVVLLSLCDCHPLLLSLLFWLSVAVVCVVAVVHNLLLLLLLLPLSRPTNQHE